MEAYPGLLALIGSGETSPSGGRIFEELARQIAPPLRIAILETPAGFELNSARVAGRVADFLKVRLQNYAPCIDVIPARKKGTPFSPDDAALLQPLEQANFIYMGAGSPTYAIRQLQGSLAWEILRRRHLAGAALCFASAAVLAVGAWALPVYEIYKVGMDVHAVQGLDLPGGFGLSLSFIPHWNNSDGGAELDTSRCFAGQDRFNQWRSLIPPGSTILGIDEHTGLVVDFARKECRVGGVGEVTLLKGTQSTIFPNGSVFPLASLGDFLIPALAEGLNQAQEDAKEGKIESPPLEVLELLEARRSARQQGDWNTADALRQKLADLGWQVRDTPEKQDLIRFRRN